MEEIKTKVCSKCGIEKDIGEFYLCANRSSGNRRSKCKDCFCQEQEQRRRNGKEIILENKYFNTLEEVKKNKYLNCLKDKI